MSEVRSLPPELGQSVMSDAGGSADEAPSFHRLEREHARLDGLDLYARVVERGTSSISDPDRIDGALSQLRADLIAVTATGSTLHGWRVQALFEAMVASLGRVRLLKLEDAGDVFFTGDRVRPPDFRIVTADGGPMLVEVKNFHQNDPMRGFRMRRSDLEELRRYADLVGGGPVKLAVYWTRWNLWTLVDGDRLLPVDERHLELALPDAMKWNEMGRLGDRIPATEWPIGLTLYSDPGEPRQVGPDGDAPFTVGRAAYSVAGREVERPEEERLVDRLMKFGGWVEESPVEIVDQELVSVSFLFSPETAPEDQEFAFHRPLSSIFSGMFNEATLGTEGDITELRVDIDPASLASLLPDNYEGEVLRIWRFNLRPAESG